jgi:diguanylate cyclase (GGDEF)-like protein
MSKTRAWTASLPRTGLDPTINTGVASPDVLRRRGRDALQAFIDASLNVTRGRPLDGPDAWLRYAPWLAAGLLAFTFIPLMGEIKTGDLIATGLLVLFIATAALLPWNRMPSWVQALPILLPFAMEIAIRLSHDSAIIAYTPVTLLPVFWFALYGTRGQLLVSVVAVGIVYAVPSPAVDGGAYPITVPIAAALWMAVAGISGFSISELVRQRENLTVTLDQMARTDALTGLPNRRAWDEALDRELARADRSRAPVCVALLDLDHFKEFNDQNGHPAGDIHLKDAALLWSARLRSADLIARYGGEEFAVLLSATDAHQAQAVIESLRTCVPSGETVSAGIAQWDGAEAGVDLLVRADRALYEAKRKGRNRTIAIHAPRFAPGALEPEPEPA